MNATTTRAARSRAGSACRLARAHAAAAARWDALAASGGILPVIGLRRVVVPDLGHSAILLAQYGLVLVDADADRESVEGWALSASAARLAGALGGGVR